jgi:hypothetical protein
MYLTQDGIEMNISFGILVRADTSYYEACIYCIPKELEHYLISETF